MAKVTTFIDFVPSTAIAPQYQITLDRSLYTMTVEWVLFPQRYYVRINDLDGTLVLYTPLVGSPIGKNIQALSWANGTVTVTTVENHGFKVGQVVNLAIVGAVPDAYNGVVEAFITKLNQFTYPLTPAPGAATVFGSVQQNIDLVESLFDSTLVYRAQNKQFEVTGEA